jgi:PAS domain S-box-containing protein
MKEEKNNSPEALRRSKALLEAIWDNSSIAICETDAEGQCLSVNKEWCKYAGISKENALGNGWQQALHPEDKERIFALWIKHAKTKKPWNFEYRFRTSENVITWVLGTSTPVLNEQGEVTGYIGLNRDITERKLSEDALKESEEKSHLLIKNSNDIIILVNENGEQVFISDVVKDITGYTAEELYGNILDVIHPEDVELVSLHWNEVLSNTNKSVRVQYRHKHKENGFVWLEAVAQNFLELPSIKSVVINIRDISERKQAEADILSITDQWQSTFDSVNDAIWLLDKEHRILRSNKKAKLLFGKDNIGKKCYNIIHGTDCPIEDCPVQIAFKQKCHKNMEFQIGNKWYNIGADPILDVNGKVTSAVHIVRDITTQRKIEDELRLKEKNLSELNTFKDKLFSIIAHDLRSPLHNILGFSELLIEKIQTFDIEESKKFATIINISTKINLHLLDNLLTWGKTQMEHIEFIPENLKLIPIVEKVFLVLNLTASLKNIKLISSLSDDIVVYADQNMLRTILRNLISNAIKFTNSEGMIDINAVSQHDHIEISVTDNGVGISEENKKKLFGADLNFTKRGTKNEGGSGLGLILCKEFVEKHNGKIWVESDIGNGSKFIFTLPVFKK